VLFTPDDEAHLRDQFRGANEPAYETELTGQARPNVLFEAGMAMGRNPDRTIIVELGTLRPFSDIAGRHTVKLSNESVARQELAQRLNTAGCPIDLSGRDWHTEGDFEVGKLQNP
jgi:predicted nucleotide-binding protein